VKITKAMVQGKELAAFNFLQDDRSISHELRMPVTHMTISMQMLMPALGQDKVSLPWDKVEHYPQILQCDCGRENGLLYNLLEFQSLKVKTPPNVLEPIGYIKGLHSLMFGL
jgi:hypothetical protein